QKRKLNRPTVTTVGAYIAAAEKVSITRPATFGSYARCLRTIVADILNLEKNNKRFYHGNATGYRDKIEAAPLDLLTRDAVLAWRKRFVQSAGSNPASQKRAR